MHLRHWLACTAQQRSRKHFGFVDHWCDGLWVLLGCEGRQLGETQATQQLLTDPRRQGERYLFFGNDPFAKPPEAVDTVAGLTEHW